MLADDRDVGPGTEDVVRRAEQLRPDQHGQEATGEQEQEDPDGVLHPDDLVVVGHAEVAHPALLGRMRARARNPRILASG